MSLLTPTASSSAIAGFALWLVGWSTFFHIDRIPVLGKFVDKEKVIDWILGNKILTILISEIFNFSIHPPSNPASTTFALGGSIFNTLMIFVLLPLSRTKIWPFGRKRITQSL